LKFKIKIESVTQVPMEDGQGVVVGWNTRIVAIGDNYGGDEDAGAALFNRFFEIELKDPGECPTCGRVKQ